MRTSKRGEHLFSDTVSGSTRHHGLLLISITALLVLTLLIPAGTLAASPAAARRAWKAVLMVGSGLPAETRKQEFNVMNRLAGYLKAHGITVYKFYSPRARWSAIAPAIQGVNLVFYAGHGYGYDWCEDSFPQNEKNGFWLDGDVSYANDRFRQMGMVGRDVIRQDVRLAPNALVTLYRSCYSAGKYSDDWMEKTGLGLVKKRINEYSATFLALGASYAAGEGEPGDTLEILLDGKLRLGDCYARAKGRNICYTHPLFTGRKVRFRYQDGAGRDMVTCVVAGDMREKASDILPGYKPKPVITRLSPKSGRVGDYITVKGDHFGSSKGGSSVKFGSRTVTTYNWWNDASAQVVVPRGVSGNVKVKVVNSYGGSNRKSFKVTR